MSLATYLSDYVHRIIVELSGTCESCARTFVTKDLSYNWSEIEGLLGELTDDFEILDQSEVWYLEKSQLVWNVIHEAGSAVSAASNEERKILYQLCDWVDCQTDVIEYAVNCQNKEEDGPLLAVLVLTAALERALGSVYMTKNHPVPFLLRDLLKTSELTCIFGIVPIVFTQLLVGCPRGFNLRNVAWHGFVSSGELHPHLVSGLTVLIASLGKILQDYQMIPKKRPQFLLFESFQEELDDVFPDIISRSDEVQDMIDKSPFIPENSKIFWKKAYYLMQSKRHGHSLVLIFPQLEHCLRVLYCRVNDCPARLLTAESTALYTTLDEILAPSQKAVVSSGLLMLLLDVTSSLTGPRVRDRLSHGETQLSSVPHWLASLVFCVALATAHSDRGVLKMAKKVSYQASWENDFSWVKESHINGCATCLICKKDSIYCGSMGKTALKSHEQGKKHKELEKNYKLTIPIKTWLSSSQSITGLPSTTTKSQQQTSSQPSTFGSSSMMVSASTLTTTPQQQTFSQPSTLSHVSSPQSSTHSLSATPLPSSDSKASELKEKWWLAKDCVTKAEILWCAHTCLSHQSLRNAEAGVNLFKVMFPDSNTALDMKLGKDKTSYSIVYGLAPFFRNHLLKNINNADYYIIGFDESLNKYSQKQQLDIVITFWSGNTDEVSSRYLSSVFLTEAKSTDLLNAIKEGLSGLDWRKIVQVSMDGPNVNVKLLRLLKKEIEDSSSDNHNLLDIGSCGLHVLNVAFKTGIQKTGWNMIEFLRACYYLFKDCPSRRGVYIKVTKSGTFPLKFCSIRWLENSAVAKRALDVLDSLKKYVEHVEKDQTQKATQSSKSFKTVKRCLEDKLLRAKLAFFLSLAEDVEPFLRQFQTDSPMAPFIYGDLLALLTSLMGKVVKEEVLNSQSLKSIEITKPENLRPANTVDIGYAAKKALRQSSGLKDADVLQFRQQIRTCLTSTVGKILEKSPLKYDLTKAITFLNPKEISNKKEVTKNMTRALEILVESNLIPASCAQNADREYNELIADASVVLEAKDYSRTTRLDSFWMKILDERKGENLKNVIKILLPLSHGNAMLERGFSVNGDLVVENLSEDSLIAQRLVYDSIQVLGGINKLVVSKDLILSVRNANQRWKEALKMKREKMDAEAKAKGEKRKLAALAEELKEKKKKLISDAAKDVAKIEEQIKELKKQC